MPTGHAAPISKPGPVLRERRRRRIDPARAVAFDALRAITAEGAYANLVLGELLGRARLEPRDAALATELVFGTSRLQGTYDAIIERASGRSLATLQPALVDALRLGAHQVLGMRTPLHAAVSATVDLAAGRIGDRVAGITNAIIRKIAANDLATWLDLLTEGLDEREALSVRTGHPRWIVDAYADLLPADEWAAALEANNVPATPTLVVRPGLADVDELIAAGGVATRYSPWGATRAGNPADVPAVVDGRAGVQDEGSQLVVLAALRAHRGGGPWLDLCAGPGGRSALLRGLAEQAGVDFVAADAHEHRAQLVRSGLRAYDPAGHTVITADGTRPAWTPDAFGLLMADVPCSGIGALRRRPEARWRHQASIVDELVGLQARLLDTAVASVEPGGLIAYATCSPHRRETIDIVHQAISRHGLEVIDAPSLLPDVPGARASTDDRFLQLWPHRHGTDAMFLALLTKPPGARP